MSPSVQSVDAGASLVAAARMMCTAHLHHLPVIDEEDRPIGILSTLDVVAAMVNAVDEVKTALGE
jgi:CBS-domain-containing membrane protein